MLTLLFMEGGLVSRGKCDRENISPFGAWTHDCIFDVPSHWKDIEYLGWW